ncbi:MAG: hypothetical protein C4551_02505 [Bacillota bacterium]|jgi:hypothetical protein|nr:MAG: hypothetical protein C4551_02505 [Bacillota bacterium]
MKFQIRLVRIIESHEGDRRRISLHLGAPEPATATEPVVDMTFVLRDREKFDTPLQVGRMYTLSLEREGDE